MRAFLVAMLLVPAFLCHGQLSSPSGVSVSGDAQVNVVPDRVTILLGVETRHKNLDEASTQNDSLVRQVLAAARRMDVNASDVQTDFIHVDLAYQNNDSTVVDYYKVTKEIQIVLKDVYVVKDVGLPTTFIPAAEISRPGTCAGHQSATAAVMGTVATWRRTWCRTRLARATQALKVRLLSEKSRFTPR
jgi:metal-dependent amidase/aminoacylase/carboxypeptidase family protein